MNGSVNPGRFGPRPTGMANRRPSFFAIFHRAACLFFMDSSLSGVCLELPLMQHLQLRLHLGMLLFQDSDPLIAGFQLPVEIIGYTQMFLVSGLGATPPGSMWSTASPGVDICLDTDIEIEMEIGRFYSFSNFSNSQLILDSC